jgi:FixJ family two-component response regulator
MSIDQGEVMDNQARTVFLIEDAPEVRRALSRMLTVSGYRVRSFESAELFLAEQNSEVPGCLLLDVCMPGLSGMELQRALAGSAQARPIVFLSGQSDIQTSVTAMKAGAVDFLTKPIEGERLVAAIDQAFQRDAEHRRECAIRAIIQRRYDSLTPRERQVIAQVIVGRRNKQIAGDMGIGEKTVKVHRERVMTKMGAHSVPELVRLATLIGVAVDTTAVRRLCSQATNRSVSIAL